MSIRLCHDAICCFQEIRYLVPVHNLVGPDTHPTSATVGRLEEHLSSETPLDIRLGQPERNRRSPVHDLKRAKRALPSAEVGMSPGMRLGRFGKCEAELTKSLDDGALKTVHRHCMDQRGLFEARKRCSIRRDRTVLVTRMKLRIDENLSNDAVTGD